MDSIDYFRGLSVILMVLVDYVGGIASVPGWLKHAPDIGLTVADLVAPAFIFAIGLTYGMSFGRRAARASGPSSRLAPPLWRRVKPEGPGASFRPSGSPD